MPATAGRVKMPAGNRMQTSASLNTHSIWQNAIGYDPYAAESSGADSGAHQEAAASARENMKALMALANKNKVTLQEDDGHGAWRGHGKLRGGWAAGKDLGELPKDALPLTSGRGGGAADDDMPSSTSSCSSDEDDRGGGGGGGPSTSGGGEGKKRAREDDELRRDKGDKSHKKSHKKEKKHKHKKSDKEKKHHKSHKSHKSEKSHKEKKRKRHSSD